MLQAVTRRGDGFEPAGKPRRAPGGTEALVVTTAVPCASDRLILSYEDTDRVLRQAFRSNPPDQALIASFLADASSDVIEAHGDNFDFLGFWASFRFRGQGGLYIPVKNDVLGIGDATEGMFPSGVFDFHASLGIPGDRLQGMLFFTNIDDWSAGSGTRNADITRLVLNHEFEHRFGVFLPDLADGRKLQGLGSLAGMDPCGRKGHWNWRVDGQGSCMEISEWKGVSPATLSTPILHQRFNVDIPGGVYSYTDLYLMGLVSPAEMDAGNSELRYMDDSNCSKNYNGLITSFSSADIIETAGPRVPDENESQKDFRAAWVMVHLPGLPPSDAQLDELVGILEQQELDWAMSTLGRSTMNNSLSERPYGCGTNPSGSLTVLSGSPTIGTTMVLGIDNPLAAQGASGLTTLFVSRNPDPAYPCGTSIPGAGLAGSAGALLVDLQSLFFVQLGASWSGPGSPAPVAIDWPLEAGLVGCSFYAQGLLLEIGTPAGLGRPSMAPSPPGIRFGLTEGLEMLVDS